MKTRLSQHCGNLASLNALSMKNMPGHLGIKITAVGAEFLCAEMPVNEKTRQPFGVLHGGASAALAESLGSMASYMLTHRQPHTVVAGVEINCSHLRAVREGTVTAVCKPLRIARSLHFWNINIYDDDSNLVCASRLTVSILNRPPKESGS